MPRSFFWIDQHIIRSGIWMRVSASARLTYVAIAASADREGLSIWSGRKLMELTGDLVQEEFERNLNELDRMQLIERVGGGPGESPGIRIVSFTTSEETTPQSSTFKQNKSAGSVVVHTTVYLGESDVNARVTS